MLREASEPFVIIQVSDSASSPSPKFFLPLSSACGFPAPIGWARSPPHLLSVGGVQMSAPPGPREAVSDLPMPKRRDGSGSPFQHFVSNVQSILGVRIVEHPSQGYGRVQNKIAHVRPSTIRSFTEMFFGFLDRLRTSSILANTVLRSTSEAAGPISAAGFPRRVMRMRSPRDARSTNSESFGLASNEPMDFTCAPNHLDD